MTPAVECSTCGAKAKTPDEPASEQSMGNLMDWFASHTMFNFAGLLASLSDSRKKYHHPNMKFHQVTPAVGFGKAEVVTEPIKAGIHTG